MATPKVTTYDFDRVSLSVGGWIVDGYAEDSAIKLTQLNPIFKTKAGVDGRVARSKVLVRTAELEVHLMASSATNDYFGQLSKSDMSLPNGAGIVPVTLKDNSGRAVYLSAQAWISELPEVDYAEEIGSRMWKIFIADLDRTDAGN